MIFGELRTVQFIASFWKDEIYEEINIETTTCNWAASEQNAGVDGWVMGGWIISG